MAVPGVSKRVVTRVLGGTRGALTLCLPLPAFPFFPSCWPHQPHPSAFASGFRIPSTSFSCHTSPGQIIVNFSNSNCCLFMHFTFPERWEGKRLRLSVVVRLLRGGLLSDVPIQQVDLHGSWKVQVRHVLLQLLFAYALPYYSPAEIHQGQWLWIEASDIFHCDLTVSPHRRHNWIEFPSFQSSERYS